MSFKMWFPDEIVDILDALQEVNEDVISVLSGPEAEAYRRGFQTAINAMRKALAQHEPTRTPRILSRPALPPW